MWVGTLSAVALALVFGLVAIALGAHRVGQPFGTWREVSFLALAFSVFGSFLAFALGGWVAAKVAGIRRSETAMLHGAIVWLVAVPILVVLASMGAGSYFGAWYGGLAGLPPAAAQALAAAPDPAAADGGPERRAGGGDRLAPGSDGRRRGRLDGLGGADDLHTLSDAARTGRGGRLVMVLILLWLLGLPLSLILILFLLGVGR